MSEINEINEMNGNNAEEKQKKLFTPVFFITNLLCLLPIVLGVILYDKLPNDIPQQYGWNNQVNWTLPKPWGFIVSPVIIFAANIVMHLSVKYTKQKIGPKVELIMQWMLCLIGLPVNAMLIIMPAGVNIDVFNVVAPVMAILFIILGNYLPKVENNGFVGVRASWTRKNSDLWAKNQRFTGKLMVILGFVILISCFSSIGKYVFIGAILLLVLIPLIYSLVIYNKCKDKE